MNNFLKLTFLSAVLLIANCSNLFGVWSKVPVGAWSKVPVMPVRRPKSPTLTVEERNEGGQWENDGRFTMMEWKQFLVNERNKINQELESLTELRRSR